MDTNIDNPNDLIGIYKPDLTFKDRLLRTTVGRKTILDDLLQSLRSQSPKKRKQHFVFIGPRGIGKTHFLRLLEFEVLRSEKLSREYTIIRFPEESHRILSFADFLLGIIEILGDISTDSGMSELYNQLEEVEDDNKIIDAILPRLKDYKKKTCCNILVLLENLDSIFNLQMKDEKSVHSFRKFLMETSYINFIGTSPTYFQGFDDVNHPLYDFFDIQVLEGLSEGQTIDLIRLNLEWDKKNKLLDTFESLVPKIKVLYEMIGGNPRLIMILYHLIAKYNLLEVKELFQKLLDQISPFYQDRIKEIAPQERSLLETMSLMRTELKTPANISKKIRKPPQQVSSLLKRMLKSGYLTVANHPGDKRSKVYRIKEGFFALWLAVSQSRVKMSAWEDVLKFTK